MKKDKLHSGEPQYQENITASYNLRELLEPQAEKYGKKQVADEITKVANNGIVTMQRILGAMYDAGIVVEQNSKIAARWYAKSAKQRYANGQFAMGCAYYAGRGVKQNTSKAIYWLKKAAIQGHIGAQCFLCRIYRNGDGVAKSTLNAFKWYESIKVIKLKQEIKKKDAEIAALKSQIQGTATSDKR